MKFRREEVSFVVVVSSGTLALLYMADAALDLGLGDLMALHPSELLAALDGGPTDGRKGWSIATVWMSCLAHGSVTHLASNLLFFWFFGTLLQQLAGEKTLLLALLLTPVSAAAAYVLRHVDGGVGVIGASGVISGVSGLYVLLSFRWEAPPVHAFPLARPIPPAQAAVAALMAAGLDIYVLSEGGGDGVARDAHIGGFAGGLILGAVLTTVYPTVEAFRRSWLGPRP